MIKVLFGVEDYCVWFKKHKIIDGIPMPEMNVAEFDAFDEDAYNFCITFPMLSESKACIINLADLKQVEGPLFDKYLANENPQTTLILLPRKVDKRSKIYKALQKGYDVEECEKLKDERSLKKMIAHFLGETKIREDACNELIGRLNYFEQETVTLWTVKNTVLNLKQSADIIDIDLVKRLVESNDKENVFKLIDFLKKRDLVSLRKQEDLIMRAEGSTVGALSALLKEFRVAYNSKLFNASPSELGVRFISLKDADEAFIKLGLKTLTDVIWSIKTGSVKADRAISLACSLIMEGGTL